MVAGAPRRPVVPALFDRIAPVYDRTRGPLDDLTAEALAKALAERGVDRLLEIGVGTGRVAGPLTDRGLRVTGVDTSKAMMAKAREKGLAHLVEATAYHLPFRREAFDGVLMGHVLHLLEDPASVLQEAGRVSRKGVFALVAQRDDRADAGGGPREDDLRTLLHDHLIAQGVELAPFRAPWRKERELLARYPPTETVPISDRTLTEPAERRIAALELRGYRNLLDVPPVAMARAIAELRTTFRGRTITSRRIYALAHWAPPVRTGPN
ncbi:MAG TPA: methyltransferase domain-containing protein [Thermoplasmata archaeon]|nr:methyltransferase domain-containing protein [Thermoplasmata archaeon]